METANTRVKTQSVVLYVLARMDSIRIFLATVWILTSVWRVSQHALDVSTYLESKPLFDLCYYSVLAFHIGALNVSLKVLFLK